MALVGLIVGVIMARSAKHDPVEVFRFSVQIVSVSLNPGNLINNFTKGKAFTQFARTGFSHVDTPRAIISKMEYRENTDNFVMRKQPGFARFNDISLRRGVVKVDSKVGTGANDFYKWLTKVNGFNPALSMMNEITSTTRNVLLSQSNEFRKDMIIILRDREGKAAKRWYLVNVFPVDYKGSTDLDGSVEDKAIESLVITYELAFELPSVLDVAKEFIANITNLPELDLVDDIDLDLGF